MTGTENQAPVSSPLQESPKNSRVSSVHSSPLTPVTNSRVQTPESHAKKGGQTPEFKVYNENVSSHQSPSSSPAKSPLRERVAVSPSMVWPTERGRRSPASAHDQSPPHIATRPLPLSKILHNQAVSDENVEEQISLRRQLIDRQAQLEKLKQQNKERDQQLRDTRSTTASLKRRLREIEQEVMDAEVKLKRTEEETLEMREQMQVMKTEIIDYKDIVREYVEVTKDSEKERLERQSEIDKLMNLIPEKLIRIYELKTLLGEE